MCVVSMVGDHYKDKWTNPDSPFYPYTNWPNTISTQLFVSKHEFDELKKEVLEMKELLKRAKEYDERTNQPNCEMEEKVVLLKKVAELFGVDLENLLEKSK